MNERFLNFYNEELFYLKEVVKEFAQENPQVAGNLGIYSSGIQDPFIERLLEGSAFLSAKVQYKLSNEQAEIALQMLERLAPSWYTPTPSMAVIAFEPDLTYPNWNKEVLSKGSKISLKDDSLDNDLSYFTTGRDVLIQPIILESAKCQVIPPSYIPESVIDYFYDALSFVSLRLTTKQLIPVSKIDAEHFSITLTGDDVRVNQILNNLFNNTLRIIMWSSSKARPIFEIFDNESLELCGLNEEDALLPTAIGEIPGSRILREYFNMPANFFTFRIKNIEKFFRRCNHSYDFEIYFLLKERPLSLVNNINSSNFKLFSTPIINLYRKRCNPVLLDNNKIESHLVVDRHNPTLHQVYNIKEVKGFSNHGEIINFSPLQMDTYYHDDSNKAAYSVRRKFNHYSFNKYRNSDLLYHDVFISLSSGNTNLNIDTIKSLSVIANVCDRHLNVNKLINPEFYLEKSLPIKSVENICHPTKPVNIPELYLAWNALQIIADNPLRYTMPRIKDSSSLIKNWLSLFININDSGHIKRINSINKVSLSHSYTKYRGPGPIAWTRGVDAKIYLLSKHHSDKGEFLFGKILHAALSEYCELNQALKVDLYVDDNLITKWES